MSNSFLRNSAIHKVYLTDEQGRLHAEDRPAIIDMENACAWYFAGKLHREGGPAIYDHDQQYQRWYSYGVLHRIDGPALFLRDGTQEWYYEGKMHRTDGPAVISPMREGMGKAHLLLHLWFEHGIAHRNDGPASYTLDPQTQKIYAPKYYYHGCEYSKKEHPYIKMLEQQEMIEKACKKIYTRSATPTKSKGLAL